MKALKHPIILAIIALAFTSCYSSQGYVYSQGHDDYGYYGGMITITMMIVITGGTKIETALASVYFTMS